MALTPEEVVNKRFQPTKFREGYDQDEVDDFLDEVVNELRRLTTENDDLRQKLTACERRVGELSRAGASTGEQAGAAPAVQESPKQEASKPEPSKPVEVTTAKSEPVSEPVATPSPASPAAAGPLPAATAGAQGPEAVTGMLALAQKLHDEHVKSGEQQRDKLVAEAQEHAGRVVHEAEEKQRQTLGSLEQERSLLERKIDELRTFEREYRSRLKSYLEGQLRDLDTKGSVVPSPGAQGDDQNDRDGDQNGQDGGKQNESSSGGAG